MWNIGARSGRGDKFYLGLETNFVILPKSTSVK